MFRKSMLKGFIGPLGDDIPSLLAVILALSLFFSALTFSYTAYSDKVNNFNRMKGSIDITRVITQEGLITESVTQLKSKASTTAMSYGVDFELSIRKIDPPQVESKTGDCKPDWLKFSYLIAVSDPNSLDAIELKILEVCVG